MKKSNFRHHKQDLKLYGKPASAFNSRKYLVFFTIALLSICYQAFSQEEKKEKKNSIQPGKRQAVLVLSNGNQVQLTANDSLDYSKPDKHFSTIDTTQQNTLRPVGH
ncbi:hypothetical protein [Carboxylicivirga taeanensis]|uniref:hypothetical protein n=1 Tax=Carboxylicivirga taeanensis TaxID=1416875 RepID=UPI003F6DF0A6